MDVIGTGKLYVQTCTYLAFQVACLLGSCFQNEVHLLHISLADDDSINRVKALLSAHSHSPSVTINCPAVKREDIVDDSKDRHNGDDVSLEPHVLSMLSRCVMMS